MSFGAEVATLFTGMSTAVVVCGILGLVCIGIEIFQPGFGVFGIIGGLLSVIAIILRVIKGDGNAVAQIFMMLFLDSIVIIAIFALMVFLSKRKCIQRSQIVQMGTAVNVGHSDGTEDFSALLGKSGEVVTALRPTGKAIIEGDTYDVLADGFYIQKQEKIKVIQIEGAKIVVSKAN